MPIWLTTPPFDFKLGSVENERTLQRGLRTFELPADVEASKASMIDCGPA